MEKKYHIYQVNSRGREGIPLIYLAKQEGAPPSGQFRNYEEL
jgi:hypothetical protein